MGHRRPHHFRVHLGRGRPRRRGPHHLRGRRREAVDLFVPGRGAARIRRAPQITGAEIQRGRAEIRSGVVHLLVPFGHRDSAIGRPRVSRSGDLPQHSFGGDRLSHPQLAGRCRAEPDRALGIAAAGRQTGHRGLARAVRRAVADEPRGETRPSHSGRDQAAGGQRHHDRQRRQAPALKLWRHAGAGAAARQRLRRGDPGAETRRHSRRRRRPAETDRAHRDHRPDEPCRRVVAAAGRSGARGRA